MGVSSLFNVFLGLFNSQNLDFKAILREFLLLSMFYIDGKSFIILACRHCIPGIQAILRMSSFQKRE